MQCLWLISILLLSCFSEGRRGKAGRQKGNRIRTSLYSRIKKDLHGVEKRIQGELGQIVETVTELKDMMEDVLIDSEQIEEVEPPAPETIDDNYEEDEYYEENGKFYSS